MTNEQGKCANCGSENIEYGTIEHEGEEIGYNYTCPDCQKSGIEWYTTTFAESVIV